MLGSNLLRGKVNHRFKPWYIGMNNAKYLSETILMGVGWWAYNDAPNFYTEHLYKKILSKKFIHSVRDEYTKKMLNSIGMSNVINTGCPTMWELTKEHCKTIPIEKSDSVIFTLTDYNRDFEADKALVEILFTHYSNIYFWVQGWGDRDYLKCIQKSQTRKINVIGATLKEYENFLENHECDYVGTRLHAGIKAMQCRKRSIIIGIDNRAIELKRDYNINCINRNNLVLLPNMIESFFVTDIRLNEENIRKWISQFD